MNKLNPERRAQIVRALCEGNSIRSTSRMTGAAVNTVVSLLVDLGTACSKYQDRDMRNLPCKRLQCDEIWSFCYAKAKNVPEEVQGQFGYGDVWTWTAIGAQPPAPPPAQLTPAVPLLERRNALVRHRGAAIDAGLPTLVPLATSPCPKARPWPGQMVLRTEAIRLEW